MICVEQVSESFTRLASVLFPLPLIPQMPIITMQLALPI